MKFLLKYVVSIFLTLQTISSAVAQFAPAAGLPGSTAISKDSSIFVEWATGCFVQRGYMDIARPDSGYVTLGDSTSPTGKAGLNGVVSLGDGGNATLTFQNPIYNGPGFDFVVFENGFYTSTPLAFLEFAFVEVSSNGNNFFRFAATSNIQDTLQIPMTGVDCSLVNNLAGKYVSGFGTPFDLEELKNEPGLDVNHITHIRIVDVVGSIGNLYATYDQFNHKINDPYPTPFPSGGFDLDAVGVIHAVGINDVEELQIPDFGFRIYPNPCLQVAGCRLQVDESLIGNFCRVYDCAGEEVFKRELSTANCQLSDTNWTPGIYFVYVGNVVAKLVIQ